MGCLHRHKKVIFRRWFFVFSSIIILTHLGCAKLLPEEEERKSINLNLPVKNKKKSIKGR